MSETGERVRGKFEQAVGNVKKNVGDATDNERLESEGRADEARGEARENAAKFAGQVKGAANQVAGTVKREVGDLIDNERLEAEGEAQRVKGAAQREMNR